jgi:hypothetical protein
VCVLRTRVSSRDKKSTLLHYLPQRVFCHHQFTAEN